MYYPYLFEGPHFFSFFCVNIVHHGNGSHHWVCKPSPVPAVLYVGYIGYDNRGQKFSITGDIQLANSLLIPCSVNGVPTMCKDWVLKYLENELLLKWSMHLCFRNTYWWVTPMDAKSCTRQDSTHTLYADDSCGGNGTLVVPKDLEFFCWRTCI